MYLLLSLQLAVHITDLYFNYLYRNLSTLLYKLSN